MRPERLYLVDIVEAADSLQRFTAGVEEKEFLQNELLQSAVLQKLCVIGEAASRLPKEFQQKQSGIPWNKIIGFRNIAVHAYFSIEWPIVWVAATEDAQILKSQIQEILAREFPHGEP